jgi:hypothetical protein
VRKSIVAGIVALAALVAAAVALAAPTTTLEVKAIPNKASSKKKIQPIQLAINIAFADAAAAQPPALSKVVIRFNKGGAFNGKLFPKCKRSALETKGPKGCPKGSKVGTGTATASAQPVIPLVNAKVTVFNGVVKGGSSTVLLYNVPDISSPIIVEGSVVKKAAASCANGTGQCDYNLVFNVPPIPTLPGQPNASVLTVRTKTLNVFVKKKKKGKTVKIPYIGAPKQCTGKWVADAQVTFATGETATSSTSASCHK